MVSRRTARLIAEAYESEFARSVWRYYAGSKKHAWDTTIKTGALYDFLYDHDYAPWFLGQAKKLNDRHRAVREWVMRLHTSETQAPATTEWSWEQRRALGQHYLIELAEDMLERLPEGQNFGSQEERSNTRRSLLSSLELDGFVFRDDKLLRPESDVLDVEEAHGVLRTLFDSLKLGDGQTTFHHLALSEEHYAAGIVGRLNLELS